MDINIEEDISLVDCKSLRLKVTRRLRREFWKLLRERSNVLTGHGSTSLQISPKVEVFEWCQKRQETAETVESPSLRVGQQSRR